MLFATEKSCARLFRPAQPGHWVHHLPIAAQLNIKRSAAIRPSPQPAERFAGQQRGARFRVQLFKAGKHQMQPRAAFQDHNLPKAPEGAGENRAPRAGADHTRPGRGRKADPARGPGFAPLTKCHADAPMHWGRAGRFGWGRCGLG